MTQRLNANVNRSRREGEEDESLLKIPFHLQPARERDWHSQFVQHCARSKKKKKKETRRKIARPSLAIFEKKIPRSRWNRFDARYN